MGKWVLLETNDKTGQNRLTLTCMKCSTSKAFIGNTFGDALNAALVARWGVGSKDLTAVCPNHRPTFVQDMDEALNRP